MSRRTLAAAGIAAAFLSGCADAEPVTQPSQSRAVSRPLDRPLDAVTPGDVITIRASDVCTPGWATAHRKSLTAAQKRVVLSAYGLPADTKVSEWDHRVALELGGGNARNIWPQLDREQDQRKDRLESRLHREVCAGKKSLRRAQQEIREFWKHW